MLYPHSLLRPTLALCLLLPGCDSGAKTDDKKADAGKADAGKADAAKGADAAKKTDEPVDPGPPPPKKYNVPFPPEGMDPAAITEFATKYGDPTGGTFTLEQAFEGDADLADKSKGKLTATIATTMGSFDCELYEDEAPLTVANFVGLARGTRPTWDKATQVWTKTKFFDGVLFHRVMADFMVQTGDGSTNGHGGNPGYVLVDELSGKHKKAGTLSMANREKPNTGNTQFFVTVKPTPHLDGKHAVFGQCAPEVATAISKVKVNAAQNNRPYDPVKIESVTISRK